MTEMKRSTKEIMYVTPHDFDLAKAGVKTATTRDGDRRGLWPVGKGIEIRDNEDESRVMVARIVYNEQMTLGKINDRQAQTIGGYGVTFHWVDFDAVYGPGVESDHELSLVGFLVLGEANG